MKSWTYIRLILFSFFLAACSRNPLGEDLQQPILNLGFYLSQTCTNTLNQDATYSCTVVAEEVIPNLVYSLDPILTTCKWATIDPVTAVISGTPTDNDVGICQMAVDSKSTKRKALTLNFNVQVGNIAPTLTIANAASILEDAPLTIIRNDASVQASEEGLGTYGFDHANTTLPRCFDNAAQLTVDPLTGAVSYAPALNYNGTCNIRVAFDDGNSLPNSIVTSEFSIVVTPVNDAPIILPIAAQSTMESTPLVVNMNISDVDSPITCSAASVTVTSSNTSIVAASGLVLSGTIPNCVLTISPITFANGLLTITVTATDGSLSSTTSFPLDVVPFPDPPVLAPIANQLGNEDTPLVFNINMTDPDTVLACNSTFLSATSSNASVLPAASISYSGFPPNCTVTLNPLLNQSGSTNIVISLTDGPNVVTQGFMATFSPVNDAPVLSAIATQTTLEDVPIVVNFTINDVDSTLSCTTSVSATSSNTTLMPVNHVYFSGTAPNCQAVLDPMNDANGTTNVSFTVTDGSLSDVKNFTFNVTAVNDAPVISTIAAQTTLEDTPLVVNFTINDVDSALTCATSVSAASSNTTLIPVANITFGGTAPNCTATLTSVLNGNGVSNLTFTVTDGSLTNNRTFAFTVTPVNDAPVMSAIGAQSTLEDVPLAVNFTINDVDNALSCATSVSALSSNATVLPVGNIVFSGTAPNCTATLAPAADASGISSLTFTLSDGTLSDVKNFTFTVTAVNDAPVISAIPAQSTLQDTPLAVNFTISDVDNVLSCTSSVVAASSNTTLLPVANIVFSGTAPNCTATLSSVYLQSGVSNLSFTVSDGTLTTIRNFTFTVIAINYPPTLSAIGPQTTAEDTAVPVSFTITDVDNTLNCATSMTAATSNAAVQPVSGVVFSGTAPNCTATMTPALNANGTANLTFTVSDGTNTVNQSFALTVSAVNDAPVVATIGAQTTNEDTPVVVNFTITDIDSTLNCATSVSAGSSNTVLVPVANIVFGGTAPNCTATVTPAANANGSANLTFTATDGSLTDAKTFALTVTAVNDAPVMSSIGAQTTPESTPLVVNFTITDIDSVLLCSSLNLSATSSNTALLPVANIVFGGTAPNCTATLTPVATLNGTANLSFTVVDNGTPNLQDVKNFVLSVAAVNDAPVMAAISAQTTLEDTPLVVNFNITDIDSALNCATSVSAASSNTTLVPVANIVFGGTAPNCTATVTPATDANGSANLTLSVTDGSLTDAKTFALTVTAVNDAPVLSTIANQTTPQDVPLVVNFTVNDIDSTLNCATSVSATSSNTGLLPVANIVFGGTAPNCTATLTPVYLQNGTSNLSFTLTDGTLTNVKNFTFTAIAVNYPPTMAAISAQTTPEDTPLVVNFTINDVDSTLNCATSVAMTSSNTTLLPVANVVFGGTAPNCTATLTPASNANGSTNLNFTVTDGTGTASQGFALTVTPVNDAPVMAAIAAQTTPEDTPLVVNFTITDIDSTLNCATAVSATSSNTAVLTVSGITFGGTAPNCTATLTPVATANGVSTVGLTVTDSSLTDTKSFSFTVTAVNSPPVMAAISAQTTPEDTPLVVNFTITDIDSTLNCSTQVTALSSNATLMPVANVVFGGTAPNCTATLTPAADANGSSNLTFTVTDGFLTNAKTFALTVTPVNDAPVMAAIAAQTTPEDTPLIVNFTITDIDSTLNCATAVSATSSNTAILTVSGITFGGTAPNCTATLTPVATANGTSNVTLTVADSGSLTDAKTFAFTVTAVNSPPVMAAISAQTTPEDTPLVVNFTITDIDSTLNCATQVTALSSNATLMPVANIIFGGTAPNCTATLTPAADANGSSNLTFTVTDGFLTNAKTFALTVTPVNDAPVMAAISAQTTPEDTPLVVNFTITDIDSTLNCATAVSATSSNAAVLVVSGITFGGTAPNCTATLTPVATANGSSNVTLTVTDSGTLTDAKTFAFTVTAVNSPPVMAAISAQTTLEDTPVVVNFNITDIDSTLNCGTSVSAASANTTLIPVANIVFGGTAPNCTATITPAADVNGSANLTLTVTDGFLTNAKTFALTVTAVNDAPVMSVIAAKTTPEDTPLVVNFTITDIDSTLNCATSVAATSSNTAVQAISGIVFGGTAPNCTATLTPVLDANGSANLTFTATDGTATDAKTFAFTVTAANDAPVMSTIATQTTPEDLPLAINFTITDVDSVLNCATSVTAASSNIAVVPVANIVFGGTAPNCTATVTPAADANGSSNLTFTVTDGSLTDAKTFAFNITAVDDAPVLSSITAQTTPEDTALAVNFTITDIDSTLNCATSVSALSSNATVLPVGNIIFSGTAPNCTATLTPAANSSGLSNVTLTVTDGTLTDVKIFAFTVTAVNDAPIMSTIAAQTTSEDTPLAINFTITDVDSVLSCTTSVSATSSNTTLLPVANVVFSGTAPNCTATVTPTANANGASNLTFTVTDGTLTDAKTFALTVSAVNDAPVLSAITAQTTLEDTPLVVNFTITDIDSVLLCSSANLAITSSNTSVLPVANVVYGGTAPNCTATLTPVANANGVSNLSLTVNDNGTPNLQDVKNFTFTVTAVNDAPVISAISAQTTLEDTPLVVNFTISDVDNVLTCGSSLTANTSNATVIPIVNIVFSGTAPNCTATITPAANQNGAVNLTIRVSDGTLFQDQTFAVTVTAVDDPPIISAISNQTISEDNTVAVNFTISDVDSTLNCSTSMSKASSNTALLPLVGIVFTGTAPNCTATLTPASNANGTANVTLTVTDGTTAVPQSFTLTVNSVNDAPVMSVISAQTTLEDVPLAVNFTITDADDILSCTSSVSATSSNATLLPVANIVFSGTAPNCTATLTSVPDGFGTSNLGFTVTDGTLTDIKNFTLTVTAVNDPPVLSALSDQTMNEDSPIAFSFTISDVDNALTCASSMSATTSDTTILPASGIVFSGTAPNCTATITPPLNQNGIVNVTFTLTDGTTPVSQMFELTIFAVNDAPVLSAITAKTTPEDTPIVVNFTLTDVDNALTCTSAMNVTSSNVALMPTTNIVFGGTVPNCTVTFSPVANKFGSSSISLFASDGTAVVIRSFTLSVTSVNDAPIVSAITAQSTLEATPIAVNFTISDVDNVLNCGSSVSMTSSNTTLIPAGNVVFSGTAPNCTATISPAGTNYGTSTIGIVATDGTLSTTSTFVLTVVNVNQAPTITSISNQTIYEGRPNTINFTIDDNDGPLTCTATNLSATSSNTVLIPVANVVFSGTYPNCVATVSIANGQAGSANISVIVTDGTANANASFTVTGNKITGVALSPQTPIVPKSSNFSFTLMATYSDGQTKNVTTTSTWTTSNTAISSFPSPGVLNNTYAGASVANSTITGTYGSFSANTVATINPATVTSLIVNPTSGNINVGGTVQISCKGLTSDGGLIDLTQSCSWASANALIASVDNAADKGLVTGQSLGSATNITATYGAFSASAAITVDTNTPATTDNGTGLTASYYTGGTNFNTFVSTRIDATVNFNWGAGNNPAGSADAFSARWTGYIKAPATGTFTIYTQSDDGVRMWVSGTQIINNWSAHSSVENSGTVSWVAGTKYPVILEFFENSGSAQIELRYSGPSTSKQIVPQLNLYP